jgi:hypothetical protein
MNLRRAVWPEELQKMEQTLALLGKKDENERSLIGAQLCDFALAIYLEAERERHPEQSLREIMRDFHKKREHFQQMDRARREKVLDRE